MAPREDRRDLASCDVYDGARGGHLPSSTAVQRAVRLICGDQPSAAQHLALAVLEGGAQARTWVHALLHADCPSEVGAPEDVYRAAVGEINSGQVEDLPTIKAWFESFAAAADAAGVPLCATAAVVGKDGAVLQHLWAHTGRQDQPRQERR
ncbi:hypothetical protein ABPG75_013263 [Micractinium tetrahymenae]